MSGGEEPTVVVSGMAARLPESDDVIEFHEHLVNMDELVTEDDRRWEPGIYGLPRGNGKLKDISKFDAGFFGIHGKQAHLMDPQLRVLLEVSYAAIIDSGIPAEKLRGSRTGVYVGIGTSDALESNCDDPVPDSGYGLTGTNRAMHSNRLSYCFDFKGPSYTIDTACSSALAALHLAMRDLRSGQCDSALVGGSGLLLKPQTSSQFFKLGVLSHDFSCKTFDAAANGYCRAEGVVAFFLQREEDCLRAHACLVNSCTNCDGYKDQGITYPSGASQQAVISQVYSEAGIPPEEVEFVETHGTGTIVGDPEEANGVYNALCKNRTTENPLLIGSVKSNMGHSEAASGLTGLVKVLMAIKTGVIPPNLHYNTPNPAIRGLKDGRIKVLTEPTKYRGGYMGVSSFGFGGVNVHVAVKPYMGKKSEEPAAPPSEIPRLYLSSGRTEDGVKKSLDYLSANIQDSSSYHLANNVANTLVRGHPCRGYKYVHMSSSVEEVNRIRDRKPLWFVFSGLGAQWVGMGKDLMILKTFGDTIRRCHDHMDKVDKRISVMDMIMNGTEEGFQDLPRVFVTNASIQVALINILRDLGIKPDGLIGHSIGEHAAGYADGALTEEQVVLSTYWRGRCTIESNPPPGAMAAVGMSWEEVNARVPEGVWAVCNNSAETVTISGDDKLTDQFCKQVEKEGYFVRHVNTNNIAFHSPEIYPVGPPLQKHLEEVIPEPKLRSPMWLCTSALEEKWETDEAKYLSGFYLTNNYLSPVRFHTSLVKLPSNCITIEISPHILMRAILKRTLSTDCELLGLMNRKEDDQLQYFFSNLGKLYSAGINFDMNKLYPPVELPGGSDLPLLSPGVFWDHSTTWHVPGPEQFLKAGGSSQSVFSFQIDASPGGPDEFVKDHFIDGRYLYPGTGYVTLAWRALARMHHRLPEQMAVELKDVQFRRVTLIPDEGVTTLDVRILPASNSFEISNDGELVATGSYVIPETPYTPEEVSTDNLGECTMLKKADIYKDYRLMGYGYGPHFQGIKTARNDGVTGTLEWRDNWVSFLDTMLQASLIPCSNPSRRLLLPTVLRSIQINPSCHLKMAESSDNKDLLFYSNRLMKSISCGGLRVTGLELNISSRRHTTEPVTIETHRFQSYGNGSVSLKDDETIDAAPGGSSEDNLLPALLQTPALKNMLDIVWENSKTRKIKVLELGARSGGMFSHVVPLLNSQPLLEVDYKASDPCDVEELTAACGEQLKSLHVEAVKFDVSSDAPNGLGNFGLVIARGLARQSANLTATLEKLQAILAEGGFLLLQEPAVEHIEDLLRDDGFEIITAFSATAGSVVSSLILCRRRATSASLSGDKFITVSMKNFDWVEEVKAALENAQERDSSGRIWLVSDGEQHNGIVGLTNCLLQEDGGDKIRCIFNADGPGSSFPDITAGSAKMEDLSRRDLVMNVYKDGTWGSYKHEFIQSNELTVQTEEAHVNVLNMGDLSSLKWIQSPHSPVLPNHVQVAIYYSALNFKDIILASGKLPLSSLSAEDAQMDCMIGLEFSGRDVTTGKKVMACVRGNGISTSAVVEDHLVIEVPDAWSLEEAASVPAVYLTVYYALFVRGRMRRGESVLIHSGSGGVGQAAIQVCLSHGCKVFTTVGTQEKREFLLKRFPALTEECIANSRDLTFEEHVIGQTNGKGVDLVLNSLSGSLLKASLRCLAMYGRFLEIGRYDFTQNSQLGMGIFLKAVTFHSISLMEICDRGNRLWDETKALMVEGIKTGVVRPLNCTTYERDEVEAAFRYMAAGKHIGKVVIRVRPEEKEPPVCAPSKLLVTARCRNSCHPDRVYILTGGLGGFGLEVAHWLVRRGCKKLILTSRSGVRDGYQARRVDRWKNCGVAVVISKSNVATIEGALQLIREGLAMGPIGGIFHLAMVLRDGLIENQTLQDFEAVCGPKIGGAVNLDKSTRELCGPEMEWFVMFSSVSCGRGNAGQTNYGFANSAMERICNKRKADGLPGIAIQWGVIGDVGVVMDNMGGSEVGGCRAQTMISCLQTMDFFMSHPDAVVSSFVLADKKMSSKKGGSFKASLVQVVANILGIADTSTMNKDTTLAEFGLDSLMGVEVKQTLDRDYSTLLNMKEIRLLTANKLVHIDQGTVQTEQGPGLEDDTEIRGGYSMLMGNVRSILSSEDIPTLVKLTEGSEEKTPFFFIHPIEGSIDVFHLLASKLEGQTCYALRVTRSVPMGSVEEVASHYLSVIRTVRPKGKFHLVGYSYGSCVATEIALQLQAETVDATPLKSPLVLIDGSPAMVNKIIKFWMSTYKPTESEVERLGWRAVMSIYLLVYFVQLQQTVVFEKLKDRLIALPSYEVRLEECASVMAEKLPDVSEDDLIFSVKGFIQRSWDLLDYVPSSKYLGDVCLLKAITSTNLDIEGEEHGDYALTQVCSGQIKLHAIEGNHELVMHEPGVSKMAKTILEECHE